MCNWKERERESKSRGRAEKQKHQRNKTLSKSESQTFSCGRNWIENPPTKRGSRFLKYNYREKEGGGGRRKDKKG